VFVIFRFFSKQMCLWCFGAPHPHAEKRQKNAITAFLPQRFCKRFLIFDIDMG
jgi:hypothetical protein